MRLIAALARLLERVRLALRYHRALKDSWRRAWRKAERN